MLEHRAAMAGEIFLNYRREDAGQAAGRIFDQLKAAFGQGSVFMDIDTVPPAVDFTSHILNSLTACRLMLVVIGNQWLAAKGKSWIWRKRRIDHPQDWVRREIEIAIANEIPLLPVLIDGAQMPEAAALPRSISALSRWNALALRHETFRSDVDVLIDAIAAKLDVDRARDRAGGPDGKRNLVAFAVEAHDLKVEAGLQTKVSLTIKNNGSRSLVLKRGVFTVTGTATMDDCNRPEHSLLLSSWTYDVDIEGDGVFKGNHYFKPNEVDRFDIIVGRREGGPDLTVYRTRLDLEFDEDDASFSIDDIYIRMAGPCIIRGMFFAGVEPEDFCKCMQENIARFDSIGYDLRKVIDPRMLVMLEKFQRGDSLEEFRRPRD